MSSRYGDAPTVYHPLYFSFNQKGMTVTATTHDDLTQVGPGTLMGDLMRQYWIPAAMASELEPDGEPMPLVLLGEALIAFRDSSGRVGVMDHCCPHRCAARDRKATGATSPGVDDPEAFLEARSGYFVTDEKSEWQAIYAEHIKTMTQAAGPRAAVRDE